MCCESSFKAMLCVHVKSKALNYHSMLWDMHSIGFNPHAVSTRPYFLIEFDVRATTLIAS